MKEIRPVRLLIAALGGEGGGVLASWITNAAVAAGHVAQRTSIPGVAQRTGATTYYLEIAPDAGNGEKPVLALNPAPGEVDVMLASELLETTRAVQAGSITPSRTHLIASTHRVFTVEEKSAMADGRIDPEKMQGVLRQFSKSAVLADLAATARAANSQLNAVMLGALAGTKALPIADDYFRMAIRAEGKAIDANLRGFEAGYALAAQGNTAEEKSTPVLRAPRAENQIEARAIRILPREAAEIALEGVRRLTDYQNKAYAARYLDRLERFAKRPVADADFLRELARLLAVRMSFEDTIRVAQLKIREGRIERLRRESGTGDDALIRVSEFMKPGPEEIFSMLPPALARRALAWVERRGWSERSIKMKVSTTSVFGFLRLRLLAGLRWWRPRTLRFAEENAWVERWLDLVERALTRDPEAAKAVVATASLVKGYGETMKRGLKNWNLLADFVIEPFLDGRLPREQFANAVTQGRIAALKDADGRPLGALIESLRALPGPQQIAAE
ncbi:MAG: indolepyruvate oxidoreductase subunit beta family protein [Xanthobacteraceae bacterium]|nr:indolepyruvate oxidoreductase subunit beta family protein [Xanthobacteraceae bacterium]MCW5673511.1 indolepyruvate oxidoreductase subunit beta family protein [Xanthobacteraceae bacterium]